MSTRYHRLARETPTYAWWRLPVAGLLGVTAYFVAAIALLVVAMIVISASGRDADRVIDDLLDSADLDLSRPGAFAVAMLSIVILLPIVLLAVRVTGTRPSGHLSSVENRVRWRWLGRTTVVAFVVYGVVLGGALAVSGATDPDELSAPHLDGTVVAVLALVLVLTPFQAAAEEYVFRGYVLQLVGSWTRFAAIPIVVSVPLFAAGHTYSFWGLVDVGIFGLTAAWLAIRTGGLEAGIAAHAANNIVLMVVEALGIVPGSDDGGPVDLVPTLISSALMVVVVGRLATRLGISTTREAIAPPPPPVPPMWPPPPYAYPPVAWGPPPPLAPAARPEPVPAAALHPHTPDYPGELPEGWRG